MSNVITQQQLDKEIVKAEVDLIVTLEKAHKKNPSLSVEQLCATKSVRACVDEVLRDLGRLADVPLRICFSQGKDVDGEPYYLVRISFERYGFRTGRKKLICPQKHPGAEWFEKRPAIS